MTTIETTTEYELTNDQVQILRQWRHQHAHGDQTNRYIKINQATRSIARLFMQICPYSKDLEVAIERLEDARNWATRAISKNEVNLDGKNHDSGADR